MLKVKMKHKLSISIDRETLEKMNEVLNSGKFRNKSHVVEYAVNRFLKDDQDA